MSFEESVVTISLPASADLSTKQYYIVDIASDGEVELTGADEKMIGVLQDKPDAATRVASIAVGGITKVVAGAAVAIGADVKSDANGKAITVTTDADFVLGTAIEAATADEDVIAVLIKPYQAAS